MTYIWFTHRVQDRAMVMAVTSTESFKQVVKSDSGFSSENQVMISGLVQGLEQLEAQERRGGEK